MIECTIYECEFCHHKKLMNKTSMKQHEDKCWYNPKNKACVTCTFGYVISKFDDKTGYSKLDKRGCDCLNKKIDFNDLVPKTNCKYWKEQEA